MKERDMKKSPLYSWIYARYYQLTENDRNLLYGRVTNLLKREPCLIDGLYKDVIVQLPHEKVKCSLFKILKDNLNDLLKKNNNMLLLDKNCIRIVPLKIRLIGK